MNIQDLFNDSYCPLCGKALLSVEGYTDTNCSCQNYCYDTFTGDVIIYHNNIRIISYSDSITLKTILGIDDITNDIITDIPQSIINSANDIHDLFNKLEKYRILL